MNSDNEVIMEASKIWELPFQDNRLSQGQQRAILMVTFTRVSGLPASLHVLKLPINLDLNSNLNVTDLPV